MCGIIGYIGSRSASDVILDGLSRLEYRGYDSAGVAIRRDKGGLKVVRAVGKLNKLVEKLEKAPVAGNIGVGHTRWATHGKATEKNAHPHTTNGGSVAVVHNGIIENYAALKRAHLGDVTLTSETDTEVAAHMIGKKLLATDNLHDALRTAMKDFEGAYALVVISADHPDELVCARVGSPLIIGVGEGENFFASDVPAILPFTKRVIYLEEGESARLTRDGVEVFDVKGKPRKVEIVTVDFTLEQAEKGGFAHFMLKEIHDQPESLKATMQGRIGRGSELDLSELGFTAADLKGIRNIQLLACGTSYYSALVAKYALQEFGRIPTEAFLANEYTYSCPIADKHTLAIAVSQSGETTDTKLALTAARKLGARTMTVCNVVGSSMTRISERTLYTRAGIEIGVASTKAYTTQILAMLMFAVWLGRRRGEVTAAAEKRFVKEIRQVPEMMKTILDGKQVGIKRCAARYQNVFNFMYIGRRYNFATAFEGALKLKEISYIHAEGYGASEMKHGPIALVEGTFPTVVICPDSPYYDKTFSNIREIKSRDGVVVAVASEGDERIKELADYLIYVPKTSEAVSPLLTVVPLQLLAYYTAVNRGCDPDKPRNLAKAVTVE